MLGQPVFYPNDASDCLRATSYADYRHEPSGVTLHRAWTYAQATRRHLELLSMPLSRQHGKARGDESIGVNSRSLAQRHVETHLLTHLPRPDDPFFGSDLVVVSDACCGTLPQNVVRASVYAWMCRTHAKMAQQDGPCLSIESDSRPQVLQDVAVLLARPIGRELLARVLQEENVPGGMSSDPLRAGDSTHCSHGRSSRQRGGGSPPRRAKGSGPAPATATSHAHQGASHGVRIEYGAGRSNYTTLRDGEARLRLKEGSMFSFAARQPLGGGVFLTPSPRFRALAHELIHHLHELEGTRLADQGSIDGLFHPRYDNCEEQRTITGWRRAPAAGAPLPSRDFPSPDYDPINEWAICQAFGLPVRQDHQWTGPFPPGCPPQLQLVNPDGLDPLADAILGQAYVDAQRLVGGGADIQRRYPGGHTSLHLAAAQPGSLRLLETLVKGLSNVGTGIDATNDGGETPLHLAVRNPACEKEVAFLIGSDADVNHENSHGLIPMNFAVRRPGNANIVRALLETGSRVDVRNIDHNLSTPLHTAAVAAQDSEMIRLLLRFGANHKAVNAAGDTPLDAARKVRYPEPVPDEVIKVLEEAEAAVAGRRAKGVAAKAMGPPVTAGLAGATRRRDRALGLDSEESTRLKPAQGVSLSLLSDSPRAKTAPRRARALGSPPDEGRTRPKLARSASLPLLFSPAPAERSAVRELGMG